MKGILIDDVERFKKDVVGGRIIDVQLEKIGNRMNLTEYKERVSILLDTGFIIQFVSTFSSPEDTGGEIDSAGGCGIKN